MQPKILYLERYWKIERERNRESIARERKREQKEREKKNKIIFVTHFPKISLWQTCPARPKKCWVAWPDPKKIWPTRLHPVSSGTENFPIARLDPLRKNFDMPCIFDRLGPAQSGFSLAQAWPNRSRARLISLKCWLVRPNPENFWPTRPGLALPDTKNFRPARPEN